MYLHYSKLTAVAQYLATEPHNANSILLTVEQVAEFESKKDTHTVKVIGSELLLTLKPEGWTKTREKRKELLDEADIKELELLRDDTKAGIFPSPDFIKIGDYKRELCNITSNFASPADLVWPAKPWA